MTRKVHVVLGSIVCLIVYLQIGLPMRAATVATGFSETLVASGLSSPTAMPFAPDGRLFVAEQGGRLRVIKSGVLLPTPFLTVTVSSVGERGLLGVAFDPQFATNQFVYVYYTATSPNVHNRISRFTANGDVAATGSQKILLDLNILSSTNHNGGALAFGPDGKLYAAVGENAVGGHAQTLANLHGKMLRINPDRGPIGQAHTTLIPTDNPFYGTATTVSSTRSGCATRLPSRSILCKRGSSSTTSATTRGKRSTTASPGQTTAGRTPRGVRPIRHTTARGMSTVTRPAVPSLAERFMHRQLRSFRRTTSTIISSPTTVAAGSAGSIPQPAR